MAPSKSVSVPALPKLPKSARKQVPCECGCGATTGRRFAPGHDAKVLAWTLRVERGLVELAATGCHKPAVEALLAHRAKVAGAKVVPAPAKVKSAAA